MRTVRSLRVLLALGVGLMAITAGLAEPEPTNEVGVSEGTLAPEAEPIPVNAEAPAEDNTVVTTTTIDPDAAADTTEETAKDPTLTMEGGLDAAQNIVDNVTDGETEGDILDSLKDGAEAVNGDKAETPLLNTAGEIAEAIPKEMPATTQVVPESPSQVVTNVADTTANLAETGSHTASAGTLGTGALANQFASSDNGGVRTARAFVACGVCVPACVWVRLVGGT